MGNLGHDIEKYLRGELSPAEMHALEKRALDDPFLAEALEGAGEISNHDFTSDLKNIEGALASRVSQKKIIPLWVWPARIAAGLLLVALSTFVILNLTKETDQEPLASNELQRLGPVPTDSIPTDSLKTGGEQGYLTMAKPEDQKLPEPERSKKTEPKLSAQSTRDEDVKLKISEEALASRSAASEKPVDLKVGDVIEDEKAEPAPVVSQPLAEKTETKEDVTELAKRKTDTRAAAGAAAAKDSDDRKSGLVRILKVSGRVTSSDDGSGLPGVNVVIKGSSTGTVTDIEGNYQVELDDPQATLVYSFIGLQSTEVPVNNNSTINVAMDQDVAQLSEVVVTGYGESKDGEERMYATFEMAEPAGGRKAFKKYLEEKLVYPQQALENNIEGKVTIQFTVETSGQLSNFNVVKGIGYGCDDEVIRLIKNGPKWAPIKRNDEPVKGRVKVRMRFTLPKK